MRLTALAAIMAVSLHSLNAEVLDGPKARHVAGGQSVSVYDYPFVVVVVVDLDQPRLCSGSLISNTWVLTATHCIDDIEATDMAIGHGYPQHAESRQVSGTVMHPDFDPLDRPDG